MWETLPATATCPDGQAPNGAEGRVGMDGASNMTYGVLPAVSPACMEEPGRTIGVDPRKLAQDRRSVNWVSPDTTLGCQEISGRPLVVLNRRQNDPAISLTAGQGQATIFALKLAAQHV
jgi:hypothetical protein